MEDGYKIFGKCHLVTIFFATNQGGELENAAAMLVVDDTLMCSFQILHPTEKMNYVSYDNNASQLGTPSIALMMNRI